MKKPIILILAASIISLQVSAFEQKDLEWFIMLNNCQKCDLSEANLEGIDLQQANLIGSSLRKAKLSKSSLHQANLKGVSLVGADLKEADLRASWAVSCDVCRVT